MKTIMMLTKRNILVYVKDKTTVFFSMMSMLIILGLTVVFLGEMNINNILNMVSVEREKATYLVNSWVMSGIIVVNAVTVTLGVIGIMVEDEDKKRIAAFLVSPVSRLKITLGYILAAFIMGCIMCTLTLIISQIYIASDGGEFLSINEIIKVLGVIIVNVFSASCFVYFVGTFIHSSSAFSALSTIVGTLVGFIAGMYLPMGVLPEMVQKVVKCFPIVYGTSLMRGIYVQDAMNGVFVGAPVEVIKKYTEYMGITLSWGTQQVGNLYKTLILLGSGIIFILLSVLVLKNRKISDR